MEVEQNLSWLRQNTFCLGYLKYFGAANRRVSCETFVTDLQVLFHTTQNSFSYERFARGLVLKQRHKVTRKWPIVDTTWSRGNHSRHLGRF